MAYADVQQTLAPEVVAPDDILRRRRMAQAMLANSMSGEPIGHWTQGLAQLAQAMMGGYQMRKADRQEAEGQASGNRAIMDALSGLGATGGTGDAAEPSGTAGNVSAEGGDIGSRLMADLQRDFQLSPEQAAGVVGNLAHESGGFKQMQEVSPMVPGSRGGYGYAQWTGPRRKAFEQFASGNRMDPASYDANYGFLKHELTNTPEGRVMAALRMAPNARAASDLFQQQFLRPGIPHTDRRRALAEQMLAGRETAEAPYSEPVGNTPSPEVMSYLGAGTSPDARISGAFASAGATPPPQGMPRTLPQQPVQPPAAQRPLEPIPAPQPMRPPAPMGGAQPPSPLAAAQPPAPTVPGLGSLHQERPVPPPAAMAGAQPPAPMVGQQAPMAGPPMPPAPARVPQPRPQPPVAAQPAATEATIATHGGQMAPAPFPTPPVKNDYASVPGQRPATPPMRPGQLMAEPYSGPMSAQDFARQGQLAMRGQGGGQPAQPRQGIMQALLGRGRPPAASMAQYAPQGNSGAQGGQRGQMAALLTNPYVPDSVKGVLLQRMMPQAPEAYTLGPGQSRFVGGQQVASVPAAPEKPEQPPSAVREYEYARQQGFPGTFQDWEASKKGGMSLQVNPETGEVTFQQGGNIRPMTEAQSKDTVYATRAEGSLETLDKFGDALTSFGENAAGSLGTTGNYLKSEEYQQAEQAGREFLAAVLRKDTGAAVTQQEMEIYGSTYLPEPGNGPQVLEQKRQSRRRALEALKAGMTPQAILAQENALRRTDEAAGAPAAPTGEGGVPEGVDPGLWEHMTPEERALWQ